MRVALLCIGVLVAASVVVVGQGGDVPRVLDADQEAQIWERLARVSPQAVPIFAAATRAYEAGELDAARDGYERVLALAPRFPDASRCLSEIELLQGNFPAARLLAYQAYGYDPSPLNAAAVAEALVATSDESRASEALALARSAAQALPEDGEIQRLHVRAALATRDEDAVRVACAALQDSGDDDGLVHYCRGVALAAGGQWNAGESELELAAELGLSPEDVEWTLSGGIRGRAWLERRLRGTGWAMLGYTVFPAILLLTGMGLGRMTSVVARRSARGGELRLSTPERFLHRAYRAVIALTSAYYYASLPLLWLALVSAWIGLLLLGEAGRHPWLIGAVALSVVLFQYVLSTIYVGLTAVARRPDPGRPLIRSEAPRLWNAVVEMAGRLHTRPIGAIYVIPDARISVQEEGRTWDIMLGKGQRCLVLGLGLLPGMTERQLMAVLAHEYAHFTSGDTAGGQIARYVHASMQRMAVQLTIIGQNRWYSPGWWYVSGFTRLFLLVTMGASRLHEILADRAAARICGVADFISALQHIARQDPTFSAQVRTEMRLAKEEGRQLANLYTLPPVAHGVEYLDLEANIAKSMGRPTSRYDTHLATSERIELLELLPAASMMPDTSGPAWELFASPGDLQAEMTDVIRSTVRRREDRLLQAVAEAHDEQAGRLRALWRRATWAWRTTGWRSRERRR